MSAPKLRTDLGEPRLFCLVRTDDVSGVSGEGRVADGVQWPDGRVSIRWRTTKATTVDADSISDVEEIHGHDGRTLVSWLVPEERPLTIPARVCGAERLHAEHSWAHHHGTSVYEFWCMGVYLT